MFALTRVNMGIPCQNLFSSQGENKFPYLYHDNKQSLQLISCFHVCIKIISCSSVNLLKMGWPGLSWVPYILLSLFRIIQSGL